MAEGGGLWRRGGPLAEGGALAEGQLVLSLNGLGGGWCVKAFQTAAVTSYAWRGGAPTPHTPTGAFPSHGWQWTLCVCVCVCVGWGWGPHLLPASSRTSDLQPDAPPVRAKGPRVRIRPFLAKKGAAQKSHKSKIKSKLKHSV